MRTFYLCLVLAVLLAALALMPALGWAQGAVELLVYFSPTCGHCELVREEILTPLGQTYGDRLTITYEDISDPEMLLQLEEEEQRLGKLNNPLPVIFVGDEIIASEDAAEVEEMLTAFLRQRLGEPGTSTQPSPVANVDSSEPTVVPVEQSSQGPALHVAYVEKDGCGECARAAVVLQALQNEYPTMVVSTFNTARDTDLIEAMGEQLGLPQTRRLIGPSVYVGDDALVEDEVNSRDLRVLLDKYVGSGSPAFWGTLDTEAGRDSILARFRSMGPLAVILAGLIDGVNPCAFATIIFLVSVLAISQKRRRDLLAVGLTFTAGVFITYLLVGLGALRLLQLASTFRIVGMVLYGVFAASCFVLAGLSARDYVLARQGRLHDMSLNLPDSLRERIKGRIRASRGAFVGGAFVSGLIVSLLELACTGQVYLPTISFVVGIPEMRAYAVAYLLLYNVVFVVPLLVVLFLTAYGVSAVRFQDWFVKNAAKTKLFMVFLFLLLGALLISQLLSV